MGKPPGDGFSLSRGWLLSGLCVGRVCALRHPTTGLPRVTGPTLEVSPDPPLRGHVTHPGGVTLPTPGGLVTHP